MMLVWLVPDMAYAANSVSSVLCKVGGYIWGPVGSMIAVLGVICIGLIAMFGRIQISSVLTVMVGIALIFGAQSVLKAMGVGADFASCIGIGTAEVQNVLNSQFYITLACMAKWFIGPVGKGVATLSMIALGLFASFGRMSWHQALLVAIGIATMFGSVSIVQSMGVPIIIKRGPSGVGPIAGNFNFLHACVDQIFSIEKIFCNVITWFNGATGKGLAALAVIILGIGAIFSKVSWPMTMIVAMGIAMIFGATSVVTALGGPGAQGCSYGRVDNLRGVRPVPTLPTITPTTVTPQTPGGTTGPLGPIGPGGTLPSVPGGTPGNTGLGIPSLPTPPLTVPTRPLPPGVGGP